MSSDNPIYNLYQLSFHGNAKGLNELKFKSHHAIFSAMHVKKLFAFSLSCIKLFD